MLPSESTARPEGRLNWPSPWAGRAELGDELAVGRELLDAVVAPVGDVDVTVRGLGDAPREVELAVAVAVASPLVEELAVPGELLYPMVAVVDQHQVVVLVEQQARDAVELTVGGSLGAPRGLDVPFAVVDRDSLQKVVSEVEVVVVVERERRRPYHLAGRATVAADLPEELVVDGRHLDADDVECGRVAPAGHEDASVGAEGEVGREVEAASALVGDEADCCDRFELEFRLCGHEVFTLTPALSLRERGPVG